MSSLWTFGNLDRIFASLCPAFEVNSVSWFFVAVDFWPFFLSVGLFAVSLYSNEVYFVIVDFFLYVDMGLNYFLQYTIRHPPPTPGCGQKYEMPSYASEQAMVFAVMMIGLSLFWKPHPQPSALILLCMSVFVPCFSRIYIGEASVVQIIAGSMLGTLEGCVYLYITHAWLWPLFWKYRKSKFLSFFKLRDTSLGSYRNKQKHTKHQDHSTIVNILPMTENPV